MQIAIKIAVKGEVRDTTMEDLVKSMWGATNFAKLVIALAEEKVWTSEYRGSAFFALADNAPYLRISHPAFLSEFKIRHDSPYELTVDNVEKAVREHVSALTEILQKESLSLQIKSASLYDALDDIGTSKAKAALVAAFPEAVEYHHFSPGGFPMLRCFVSGDGITTSPIYVVRTVNDKEGAGGIAKVSVTGAEWYKTPFGVGEDQKLGIFWIELARAFVTRKHPKIRADMLSFKEIKATTNSVSPGVEYVSFKFSDGEANVLFDTENLPSEVRLIPWGYSS